MRAARAEFDLASMTRGEYAMRWILWILSVGLLLSLAVPILSWLVLRALAEILTPIDDSHHHHHHQEKET